ncbi:hypothetical protein HanPI659440_Chr10g0394111 [Helianthus annuus]|nr:hypothetical protein HanPI659440_Chr10g0394111 [Helianthus annuus]
MLLQARWESTAQVQVPEPINQSRMDLGCRRIEKSNLVIKELLKEKDEEKERLNGVIAGLLADKEKDKVDKDVMLNRMSQIEATLTAMVRR